MPIPQWEEIKENQRSPQRTFEAQGHLILMPSPAPEANAPTLGVRIIANTLDLVVVSGLGFGVAKIFLFMALAPAFWHGLVGPHAPSSALIASFWPLWAAMIWVASTLLCSLQYFVLIPYFYQRTLGQGLCGLTLVSSSGKAPTMQQLLARYSIYVLSFTSAGFPLYYAWRRKESRLFADEVSGTYFIK